MSFVANKISIDISLRFHFDKMFLYAHLPPITMHIKYFLCQKCLFNNLCRCTHPKTIDISFERRHFLPIFESQLERKIDMDE